jgi:hypothetical protein
MHSQNSSHAMTWEDSLKLSSTGRSRCETEREACRYRCKPASLSPLQSLSKSTIVVTWWGGERRSACLTGPDMFVAGRWRQRRGERCALATLVNKYYMHLHCGLHAMTLKDSPLLAGWVASQNRPACAPAHVQQWRIYPRENKGGGRPSRYFDRATHNRTNSYGSVGFGRPDQ